MILIEVSLMLQLQSFCFQLQMLFGANIIFQLPVFSNV